MRTFKKIIAVLVTLSMLLGAVALTASAGELAEVKLVGRTQLEEGDTYSVDLVVSTGNGGVQGTIFYNTAALDFDSVVYSEAFANKNKGLDDLVRVDEANGAIAFIGLNPGTEEAWFTINFTALTTAETSVSVGDGTFDLMISDEKGTGVIGTPGITLINVDNIKIVTPGQVKKLGATIKGTGKAERQDIKFISDVNYVGDKNIVEYGVIFLPAQLLKGQELVADPNFDYNPDDSKTVKAAIATYTGENLDKTVRFAATLTGSASFNMNSLLNVDFVSRSYIKLADGEIIYSNNDGGASGACVDNGYATKSIASVAVRMGQALSGVEAFANSEDKTALDGILAEAENISNVQVKALLEILVKYPELIPNNQQLDFLEERQVKKFIDAEIDIKLLTAEEALLVEFSTPDLNDPDNDFGWDL